MRTPILFVKTRKWVEKEKDQEGVLRIRIS